MALLEDLKQDLIDRVNRVDNTEDMLSLFSLLQAPLDVDILETYFGWYRIKTLEEVPEYEDNPDYYNLASQHTQYYAKEVQSVRLLQIDTDRFINKNLSLDLRGWMIEQIT